MGWVERAHYGRAVAAITVRRPEFEWPTDLPVLPLTDDCSRSCELVALSFTLPYLEPYLIRTMRVAAKLVDRPELAAEMKAFSGQEAQHYKNHARVNDLVRSKLQPARATELRALENDLDATYRRFSDEKSLAFNLAYAEGFEAMTFALARSVMRIADVEGVHPQWGNLIAWHLAEEIEHRTVTFDAYEAIIGRYPYRVTVGSYAQLHFLRHLLGMAKVLQADAAGGEVPLRRVVKEAAVRNWRNGMIPGTLRTLSPSYDPRRVTIPDEVITIAASQGVELA